MPLEVLNTREAAKRIGLSKSTLDKLRCSGGGPVYLKLGRSVVYLEADILEWLGARRRNSTSVAIGRH